MTPFNIIFFYFFQFPSRFIGDFFNQLPNQETAPKIFSRIFKQAIDTYEKALSSSINWSLSSKDLTNRSWF